MNNKGISELRLHLPGKGASLPGIGELPDLDTKDRLAAKMCPLDPDMGVTTKFFLVSQGLVVACKGGHLHGIIPRPKMAIPSRDRKNGQLDEPRSGPNDFQPVGRLPGEIDDPPGDKGTPIIDQNINGAAIGKICHPDHGAQGKRPVGGREGMFPEDGPTGGALSIKGGSIPGGPSDLRHPDTAFHDGKIRLAEFLPIGMRSPGMPPGNGPPG